MPKRLSVEQHSPATVWAIGLAAALVGLSLGSYGVSVATNGVTTSVDTVDPFQSQSNGNGTVPWYYLTIYTIGIVFLSYYLGGVFNSQLSCPAESEPSATLLRLRSHLTFLPISQFIRNYTKHNERRSIVPILLENVEGDTATGKNISNQTEILIDAILEGYILPWYHRISDEKTFPLHSKIILHFIFEKLRGKIQKVCF